MSRNRRGYTLLELTIMIAVGSILSMGLGKAASNLLELAVDNRNYLIALNIAKKEMAIMNNTAYASVVTGTPASDAVYPNFTYAQTVSTLDTVSSRTLKQIQLDVSANGRVWIRLYTYRSDAISFGDGV